MNYRKKSYPTVSVTLIGIPFAHFYKPIRTHRFLNCYHRMNTNTGYIGYILSIRIYDLERAVFMKILRKETFLSETGTISSKIFRDCYFQISTFENTISHFTKNHITFTVWPIRTRPHKHLRFMYKQLFCGGKWYHLGNCNSHRM